VTCLCLTRNRRQWLPKAIDQFLNQTYPHRELLILADGEDVRDLVPDDERIRLLHLEGARFIGEKRNLGCERALGDVIAHWDDDDFSAPGRLADQLARLESSGKAVTGYCSMRFTDGNAWWEYRNTPDFAVGTSLMYRRDWWKAHPFPAKQVGEDGDFVMTAQQHRQIFCSDAGEFMHATIHAGNTSPRTLMGNNWRKL
jgi:glycosyltransferase involved in cell wall biosynthesis